MGGKSQESWGWLQQLSHCSKLVNLSNIGRECPWLCSGLYGSLMPCHLARWQEGCSPFYFIFSKPYAPKIPEFKVLYFKLRHYKLWLIYQSVVRQKGPAAHQVEGCCYRQLHNYTIHYRYHYNCHPIHVDVHRTGLWTYRYFLLHCTGDLTFCPYEVHYNGHTTMTRCWNCHCKQDRCFYLSCGLSSCGFSSPFLFYNYKCTYHRKFYFPHTSLFLKLRVFRTLCWFIRFSMITFSICILLITFIVKFGGLNHNHNFFILYFYLRFVVV